MRNVRSWARVLGVERDVRIEALAVQVEQLTMLLGEARRAGKR